MTAPLPPEPGRAPWLAIVGIGEDGRAGLSPAAAAALDGAEVVYGGRRHLALAAPLAAETRAWPSPIGDAYPGILARRGRPTCLLATGDPFHYGIGAEIARLVPAAEIRAFPQPSAFSLAAARLGWSLPETACLTLHGRDLFGIVPHLQPGARLLALSWDGATPAALAALLAGRGLGTAQLTVLEAMGGPDERVRAARADDFDLTEIAALNTVAVEIEDAPGARIVPLSPGLDDGWFENDGQLTKAEIRAVTLAALRPRAGAEIPQCLAGPRAVFVGGGVAEPGLLAACRDALPADGRCVANAVTLEGEAALLAAFAEAGGALRRLSVAQAVPVGGLTGWRPAMPITQWVWTKP
ncbi:precorrin-6y C5,15-methyltransferase (decarboxylating) subunit CbiE [Methylorubrum podarium]|uniref:Precorrin-6y C5,15-methyltransferase (Decarboxylating) subunit CbiE n=1 Tax=Methylorubrum podarium TaxID=200476 RepID=A0ABV1QP64_9HYPH